MFCNPQRQEELDSSISAANSRLSALDSQASDVDADCRSLLMDIAIEERKATMVATVARGTSEHTSSLHHLLLCMALHAEHDHAMPIVQMLASMEPLEAVDDSCDPPAPVERVTSMATSINDHAMR